MLRRILAFSFFLIGSGLFAGVTGKLAGTVLDNDTRKPLVGVNIILNGADFGTASDQNGYFVILNIPPGEYSVTASTIGYQSFTYNQVAILIDRTTELNFELEVSAVEMDAVQVSAKRALVEPDVSASQFNMDSETIKTVPGVRSVPDLVNLQAGIQNMHIRGGSMNQTGYLVDGFILNDERSNLPYTSTALSSIQEVQVQTGGFSAQYGNIRSGVINVVTKEGPANRYTGTATVRYSPPMPKHFGRSIYDPNSYFLRPYMDTTVCWTGTSNGNWDTYTQKQYPSFEGWNSISQSTLDDNDPTNDLTPEAAKKLFEWQHRRQGDIKKPDRTIDFGIGGPLIHFSKFGNVRFYLSQSIDQTQFLFPLSVSAYTNTVTQLKIVSDLSRNIKLTVIGLNGKIQSVSPYTWKVTPTGSVLQTTYDVASLLNSSSGNSILYMPGYFSPTDIYRNMLGIKLNHVLSNRKYYDVIVQYMENRYDSYQISMRDTSKTHEIVNGLFVDEAPFGYWGYGVTGIDGMSLGGWMNLGRDQTRNSTAVFKVDFVNQFTDHQQLKTGLDYVQNAYKVRSSTVNPSMSTWNRDLKYDVYPFRFALYVEDKIEYKALVANIGLRGEMTSSNTDVYKLEDYDPFFKQGLGNTIESEAPIVPSKIEKKLSPVLGISHPITTTSKLYFNYGHFYSEPESSYRFRLQRESNGLVTSIGNPNLELERTIAYELGYAKSIKNIFVINLAGYYKDVTNQAGWIYYQNINNSVQYDKAANNNYADIRGFELTLNKTKGDWFSGFINYTYMVTSSGYFGLTSYYQDPNSQREFEQINPAQSKPHPQPYARANLNFFTPARFGPKVIGNFYPFADWSLIFLGSYISGTYSTYNPQNIPSIVDNIRWVDRYNVDLKISKSVRINTSRIEFFVDVANLLNTKYLSSAGFSDNYDYVNYIESLHFDWETGKEQGHDRVGMYRKPGVPYQEFNPTDPDNLTSEEKKILKDKAYIDMPNLESVTFLNPRDITFGFTVEF